MLYCSAVQSSVNEFRSQDFLALELQEAPPKSNLVYSILSPEWNADKTPTRFVIGLQSRLFYKSICAGRNLWRAESIGAGWTLVMRIPVTTY
jgi:hypothetical protein